MFYLKEYCSSMKFIINLAFWLFVVFVIFVLSLLNLFSNQNSLSVENHRFKREILLPNSSKDDDDDKKHYIHLLRRMLANRRNSTVLSDCTINMASHGVYRIPKEKTFSFEIIQLVEENFRFELEEIRRFNVKIQSKLTNSRSFSSFEKIRQEFRLDLRLLLASQIRLKQVDLVSESNDNGPLLRVKYFRSNRSVSEIIDYENIDEQIESNSIILQTFTVENARETLNNNEYNEFLSNKAWWLGPVLCEKNLDERFLMAHIFPLPFNFFLIAYFNISSVDINQCANHDMPFGNTHLCPPNMQCLFQSGQGFVVGSYHCTCKGPHGNLPISLDGYSLEMNNTNENDQFKPTINTCECNPESCLLTYKRFARTVIVIIQSIFIVFVAILAAIVFQRRKLKIIKHSMWILLELILFGAALLYASVIVESFSPHGVVCLIIPWLRELGFTIVYGTLILRIYKMLAEFQSRKAHCVQVKEKDILRILFFIAISITGYLLGWTFVNVDHTNENLSLDEYLLGHGFTYKNKRYFRTCRPRYWDYLVQFAEFIFLCVGIRFIYSTRTAPCEYHERKLITIVVVCEMLFSTLLHVIRDCLWASIDPDSLFVLSFIRCHFTVTCMIIFIFCTKLCYIFRPFHEEYTGRDRFRSFAEGVEPADIVTKLQSNGDIEFGELSIRDMDPEEIRTELKRLYTSLHVLKTKTLRKENPHLNKRQGQRKKIRRFSMQAFQRHTTGHTTSNTTGVIAGAISHVLSGGGEKHDRDSSKTPEESTDEGEDIRARTVSDVTSSMTTAAVNQRVTFK